MAQMAVLVAVAILLAMAAAPSPQLAEATISCGQVVQYIAPCIGYAQGGGYGSVPQPCCSGIAALNNVAWSTPDRQATCWCLKAFARSFPGAGIGAAANIPYKCNVRVPYVISPSTDCSRVK